MNRVLRVFGATRKPTLRFMASYFLTPYSGPSPKPVSLCNGYRSTVGCLAAIGFGTYMLGSFVGGKGLLFLWLITELLFFFVNMSRSLFFELDAELDVYEIRHYFEKFLRSLRSFDPLEHLNDWFVDDALCELPQENVLDLMAYAFAFQKREKDRPHSASEQLFRELLSRFQLQLGTHMREGFKPNVRFRSHLWDNLRVTHYPLTLYLLMEALGVLFACMMALLGFLSCSYGQRRYFLRVAEEKHRRPILFVHGLGIGPIIYIPFIWLLCQLGHPLLVTDMRHVSLRFCFDTPSIDVLVQEIDGILRRHSMEDCIVVGHSYGTFIASRLNSTSPHRVAGLCLIDPVCCVMHNPKLLRTFVYGTLDWSSIRNFINSGIMSFLSHDPSIAAAVCRQFRWMQLNLWPEDIPEKTILVLSEGDALVPVDDVVKLFRRSDALTVVHPSHSHGSFVGDQRWQQTIVEHIRHTFRQGFACPINSAEL